MCGVMTAPIAGLIGGNFHVIPGFLPKAMRHVDHLKLAGPNCSVPDRIVRPPIADIFEDLMLDH